MVTLRLVTLVYEKNDKNSDKTQDSEILAAIFENVNKGVAQMSKRVGQYLNEHVRFLQINKGVAQISKRLVQYLNEHVQFLLFFLNGALYIGHSASQNCAFKG